MNRISLIISLGLATALIQAQLAGTAQKKGVVPDKETAIAVSGIYLEKAYGKERVAYEKPFTAELKEGVWHVRGASHETMAGTMEICIRRSNGEVTYLFRHK